ncbi:MAG: hypothetical protein H7Y59_13480 [Anaerolineales bacterium]|nr:hypothetical protein [Anaerolineales bacterium]
MKKQLIPILITLVLVSAYAILQNSGARAAPHMDTAPSTDVSFSQDVQPILERRCSKCHMGEFTSENLNMETYESLMAGSQNGPVIVSGNASASLLVEKVVEGEMPKRGQKLTSEQIQIITDWINAGAQNN